MKLTAVLNRSFFTLAIGGILMAYGLSGCGGEESPPRQEVRLELKLPPDTAITRAPAPLTNSARVVFEFAGTSTSVSFLCHLDSQAFQSCTSPHEITAVGDGVHRFEVKAVSPEGVEDPLGAVYEFEVDTVAPRVEFLSYPPALTRERILTFQVRADEPAAFECVLDQGPSFFCAPSFSLGPLAEGVHTVQVQGSDLAGNRSPLLGVTVEVDATPPDTVILSGPSSVTNAESAAFTFTATDAVAFECSLDGGGFSGCSSPKVYSNLSEGVHRFEVRARDGVGNWDLTPAVWVFLVDTSRANVTVMLTSTPNTTHENYNAGYTFIASDSGASFECSWDGEPWQPCSSPSGRSWLEPGVHLFRVRARDIYGNYSSEVTHTFRAVNCDGPNLLCSIVGVDPTLYSFDSSNPLLIPLEGREILAHDTATGNLYVSDYLGCRIYRVTPQGVATRLFGTGQCAFTPNGSDLSANPISYVGGLAFYRFADGSEYLYFSETSSHCIRRVRVSPTPTVVSTVAGICNSSGFADGPTANSQFYFPQGITVTLGIVGQHPEIYVADYWNHRVRKISGGTVSTLAGTGTPTANDCSNLGDNGPAGSATLHNPIAVWIHGGNVLVADLFNQLIRYIPGGAGNISSIAGQCKVSGSSDNVTAGSPIFQGPRSVYVDPFRGGYWVGNSRNQLVWIEGFSTSSLAHQVFPPGSGVGNFGDFGGRSDARLDDIDSIFGDATGVYLGTSRAVKYLVLYSGLGPNNFLLPVLGPSNDQHGVYPDLPASKAPLGYVYAVTVSPQGKLAYCESHDARVQVVEGGVTRKVVDIPSCHDLEWHPSGLTLYVASSGDHKIYTITVSTSTVNLLAGSTQGYQEGIGSQARFNTPTGLWLDQKNLELYVADNGNHCIRKVNLANQQTALVSGLCGTAGDVPSSFPGSADLLSARFRNPYDLVGDPALNPLVLYVADTFNYKVRELHLGSVNLVHTFMGSGSQGGCPSGTNRDQAIDRIFSLALDPRGGKALLFACNFALIRYNFSPPAFQVVLGPAPAGRIGFFGHLQDASLARTRFYYLTFPLYHPQIPGVFPNPGYIYADRYLGRIYRISNPPSP